MGINKGWVVKYCKLNCVKGLGTFFCSLWAVKAKKSPPKHKILKWEYLGFQTKYRAQLNNHL